jgi:hypothetical protein
VASIGLLAGYLADIGRVAAKQRFGHYMIDTNAAPKAVTIRV